MRIQGYHDSRGTPSLRVARTRTRSCHGSTNLPRLTIASSEESIETNLLSNYYVTRPPAQLRGPRLGAMASPSRPETAGPLRSCVR